MGDIDYREGWDKLCLKFSDEGREVCRALDFNETAFKSDLNFLLALAEDLFSKRESTLVWKYESRYVTSEGMQVAMDSLKRLPNFQIVRDVIAEMRKLIAKLGIEEVAMENPTEPKIGDRLLIKFNRAERTEDIQDVRDGYIYFSNGKKTRFDNVKFTRNLRTGPAGCLSVGEGWMIIDYSKIEDC